MLCLEIPLFVTYQKCSPVQNLPRGPAVSNARGQSTVTAIFLVCNHWNVLSSLIIVPNCSSPKEVHIIDLVAVHASHSGGWLDTLSKEVLPCLCGEDQIIYLDTHAVHKFVECAESLPGMYFMTLFLAT